MGRRDDQIVGRVQIIYKIMQIKSTLKYFSSIRLAKIQNLIAPSAETREI